MTDPCEGGHDWAVRVVCRPLSAAGAVAYTSAYMTIGPEWIDGTVQFGGQYTAMPEAVFCVRPGCGVRVSDAVLAGVKGNG